MDNQINSIKFEHQKDSKDWEKGFSWDEIIDEKN